MLIANDGIPEGYTKRRSSPKTASRRARLSCGGAGIVTHVGLPQHRGKVLARGENANVPKMVKMRICLENGFSLSRSYALGVRIPKGYTRRWGGCRRGYASRASLGMWKKCLEAAENLPWKWLPSRFSGQVVSRHPGGLPKNCVVTAWTPLRPCCVAILSAPLCKLGAIR